MSRGLLRLGKVMSYRDAGEVASLIEPWHFRSVRVSVVAWALFVTACPPPPQSDHRASPERPLDPAVQIEALPWTDDDELLGLSGASARVPGEVWVAPERTGRLVAVPFDAQRLGPHRALPLEGLPPGLDVEAIAFLDGDHILLGTEAHATRTKDPVYFARIEDRRVIVLGALMFDHEAFEGRAKANQGIEGLCTAPGKVIAASEHVDQRYDRRWARLGVFELPGGTMTAHRVELRSKKGKISALACRPDEGNGGVEVHAIERHFGTLRLVRFVLPETGSEKKVVAQLVAELSALLPTNAASPNIEGLTWVGDRTLFAVSDNHYRRKTGPPQAFLVRLSEPENQRSPP